MARFKQLLVRKDPTYSAGSPVVISAEALLADNKERTLSAQVKYTNVGTEIITGLVAEFTPYAAMDRVLEAVVYQYRCDNIKPGADFAQDKPVVLPIETVDFKTRVLRVLFSDGTTWDAAGGSEWEKLPPQKTLLEAIGSDELLEQYAISVGKNLKYAPLALGEGSWLCGCGTVNGPGRSTCLGCRTKLATQQGHLDEVLLRVELGERLEKERRKAEMQAKLEAERAAKEAEEAARRRAEEEMKRAEEERKRKKANRITAIVGAILVALIAGYFIVTNLVIPSRQYSSAVDLMEAGDYYGAIAAFEELGNYADAENMRMRCFGFLQNRLSAGGYFTVGILQNGTVIAAGSNANGECDVSEWRDIVAVSAGQYHAVGLRSDGTVVATGSNESGQCDVSDWTDIVAVSAGWSHSVGLRSDGTVIATLPSGEQDFGQCDVSGWADIIAVSAGGGHTVGLRSDGTVVATGLNENGQCDVSGWTDIVAVSAGTYHTVGLRSDGTVVTVGLNSYGLRNVSTWTEIVAISAGEDNTVGLRSDGTVVAVGNNDDKQCNVSNWTDIVAISAGGDHTVALRSDGGVNSVGSSRQGQRDVTNWRLNN